MNFSKRGISYSAGGRGYTVNLSKRGVRRTVSIPGTGLSYSSSSSHHGRRPLPSVARPAALAPPSQEDLARFDLVPSSARAVVLILSGLGVILGISTMTVIAIAPVMLLAGLVGALIGAAIPTTSTRFYRELDRRRQQFRAAITNLPNAGITREMLARLSDLQRQLRLTDDEAGRPTVELLHGYQELFAFEDTVSANQRQFPKIAGHEEIVETAPCYFAGPGGMHKRGVDEVGTIAFSDELLLFVGTTRTSIPWNKIALCQRSGTTLAIQRVDRQTPTEFRFAEVGSALKAELIGKNLIAAQAKSLPSSTRG
jgi:hypothetical protein